jgi:hypothetical protein
MAFGGLAGAFSYGAPRQSPFGNGTILGPFFALLARSKSTLWALGDHAEFFGQV